MSELPYMKFYPGDYLMDTTHLTTEEHGAYLLLLMNYWTRGGALPNDDRRLARVSKLTIRRWKAVRPSLEEFFLIDDHTWIHKRVEVELKNARKIRINASKAGRMSASARSSKSMKSKDRTPNGRSTDVQRTRSERATISEPIYNPLTPLEKRGSENPPVAACHESGSGAGEGAKSIGELLSGHNKFGSLKDGDNA